MDKEQTAAEGETAADRRSIGRLVGGVRGRSALMAGLVVLVALALGSLALIGLFANRLQGDLDTALMQQAQDRVVLFEQGVDTSTLLNRRGSESFVGIEGSDGSWMTSPAEYRPKAQPYPAGVDPSRPSTRDVAVIERGSDGEADEEETKRFRLVSARSVDASALVIVGADPSVIEQPVRQLGGLFAVAVPLVSLLVAGLTWLTTGSALRPVERIRSRAAEITGSTPIARVPVPDARDEIHDLAVTMNDMLARLEVQQQSQLQFTADASHELKSPVANLRALVETAELDADSWPNLRDSLTNETDRLRDLVDNLLFLASGRAGGGSANRSQSLDLDEVLFLEAEMLSATGRVRANIDAIEPVSIVGDPNSIKRLVRNLVDNAARHADQRVSLACRIEGDEVILRVDDDGEGIAADQRDRVFERFSRLDDARARDAGGAGLGLAIVRQIADDHGARVSIQESADGGASFEVSFPVTSI